MKSIKADELKNSDSTGVGPTELARLHIVCDADVGLFNLIRGALAHIYWALNEGRIPVIYFGSRNCYWVPQGYRGKDTVWEYYFEPVIAEYPVSRIPSYVIEWLSNNSLERSHLGEFVDEFAFVSRNGGWHVTIDGESLWGGLGHQPLSLKTREATSALIRNYIRPRDYILDKVIHFFRSNLEGHDIIDQLLYTRVLFTIRLSAAIKRFQFYQN